MCELKCLDKLLELTSVMTLLTTEWLDDIGLPQYKDQFAEARVDGRMLHYLTVVSLGGQTLGL